VLSVQIEIVCCCLQSTTSPGRVFDVSCLAGYVVTGYICEQ